MNATSIPNRVRVSLWTAMAMVLGLFSVTTASAGVRAGAFAQDVTPEKFPISVNGGFADRQATQANDRLHARCLVLDDGKTPLALVVVDSCMIPRELMDEAKQRASQRTGIPTTHILISATHTHSAPTVAGVFQSDPDADYVKFLPAKIAEGIEQAYCRLAPAKIGWATVDNPRQLFNRRWKMKPGTIDANPFGGTTDQVRMNPGYQHPGLIEPAGPIDPQIVILSVQRANGEPLALLAVYSLHYVGGNPQLSADYFGAFAERLSALLAPQQKAGEFVAMLANGTSGDVNNINFAGPAPTGRKPGEQIRLVAEDVAQSVKQVYGSIVHREQMTFAVAQTEIELGVRRPNAAEVQRAKEILASAPKPLKTSAQVYARETVLLEQYPPTVQCKLQAMRIGELGITGIPCEVFTEIGLEIKKRSPLKPTAVISLANGYNGYLPTPRQHQLGGYETWRARSSYLEVNASEKITATVMDLLGQVAK